MAALGLLPPQLVQSVTVPATDLWSKGKSEF